MRVADKTVEIFRKGQRVASHIRAPNRRGHTTLPEHMPSAHRNLSPATQQSYVHAVSKFSR